MDDVSMSDNVRVQHSRRDHTVYVNEKKSTPRLCKRRWPLPSTTRCNAETRNSKLWMSTERKSRMQVGRQLVSKAHPCLSYLCNCALLALYSGTPDIIYAERQAARIVRCRSQDIFLSRTCRQPRYSLLPTTPSDSLRFASTTSITKRLFVPLVCSQFR